jgi:hypothetical protein
MAGHGGLHIRDLKETWQDCPQAVQELVGANLVLCARHKDGRPSVLYFNEMPDFKPDAPKGNYLYGD